MHCVSFVSFDKTNICLSYKNDSFKLDIFSSSLCFSKRTVDEVGRIKESRIKERVKDVKVIDSFFFSFH